MAVRAFLGVGSNLGDRLEMLQRAVTLLSAEPSVRVVASSRVYETDPVGGPPQPDYLNAVIEIQTELLPRELLLVCQRLEGALGRERRARWGPRTVDLDILTYGEACVDDPLLQIPHPRMHRRGFVLAPLLELEPDPPLPRGRRIATMRLAGEFDGVRPFAPPLSVPSVPPEAP